MIRALIIIAITALATACHTARPDVVQPKPARLTCYLPPALVDPTLFLPPNPTVTLPNGTTTRFSELLRPLGDSTYTVVVWASWCPPDTLPQEGMPLIMLSIDQCADAWRVATSQLPPIDATHAQIDPYVAEQFLQSLGIYGIPHIVRFER